MATILVVDDEPLIRDLCTHMLQSGNHDVLQASRGAEALQLLQERPRDLVLLDVNMPEMDGVTLASNIHRVNPSTKILLMTGYGAHEVAGMAATETPYDVIWKPFQTKSLLTMIDKVLNGNRFDC